jgi:hypothetical protein
MIKRPSKKEKVGIWITLNLQKYRKNILNLMRKQKISDLINDPKYSKNFITIKDLWVLRFEKLKKYIDDNDKTPTDLNDKKLSIWLYKQKMCYVEKTMLMKQPDIYNTWHLFINDEKYKKYFKSNVDIWFEKFNELKQFYAENNKLPTLTNNLNLHYFLSDQQKSHRKKLNIMRYEKIYNLWTEFLKEINFKPIKDSNYDLWMNTLKEVKQFITENNKKPTNINNARLSNWIKIQKSKYKKNIEIMKNPEIRLIWENFMHDYKDFF